MVKFSTAIQQFAEQGEKTGWTYIEIPADMIILLNPGNKKSFRVKGNLDKYAISSVALLPMGGGRYIMPFNAAMRRGTHKKKGAMLDVRLTVDTAPLAIPHGFTECLADEPEAHDFFEGLKLSQRNYFLKWITGVKSETARAGRIAQVITALSRRQDFVGMIRNHKEEREKGF